MNPKAGQVAAELRRLADALDAQPEAEVVRPWVFFSADTKEEFLNTARLLPRPLKKSEDSGDDRWKKIRIEYKNPVIGVDVSVLKSLTCELVHPATPAVYRCVPILSEAEDEAMEVA